jgi:hypothetical protein
VNFEQTNHLMPIRTRSIPTAAHIWVVTGVAPRVLRRPGDTDAMFIWDEAHEPKLRAFLAAKDAVVKLGKEGS